MKRYGNIVLCIAIFALVGCSIKSQTVVPPSIVSTEASADENRFDSGDISYDADGATKSQHWLERYDAMLAKYGDRLTPPVKPGDRRGIIADPPGNSRTGAYVSRYRVTAQVSARFTRMNLWRKAEAGP